MRNNKNQSTKYEVLRIVGVLGFLYLMIFGVTNILSTKNSTRTSDSQPSRQTIENLLHGQSQELSRANLDMDHQRCWQQLRTKEELCIAYSVEYDNARLSTNFKKKLRKDVETYYGDYQHTWKKIYGSIYNRDPYTIKHIADSLAKVGEQNEMTKIQLARAVVSFVQDIPYWYIRP